MDACSGVGVGQRWPLTRATRHHSDGAHCAPSKIAVTMAEGEARDVAVTLAALPPPVPVPLAVSPTPARVVRMPWRCNLPRGSNTIVRPRSTRSARSVSRR